MNSIPRPRRDPGATLTNPPDSGPLRSVVVTETHRFVITDAALLIRHGRRIAGADPESAAGHGWAPSVGMTAVTAFRLLLADSDPVEISERADRYGLRITDVSTLATNAVDDSTIYESETSGGDD
ncbi:hypothetical protein ACFC7A_19550 [Streptomyces niveus]|uniref:hypothetical protein n=1 Tax=Streptomyces niveus TaxID=193462 RepID=UPI0035E23B60